MHSDFGCTVFPRRVYEPGRRDTGAARMRLELRKDVRLLRSVNSVLTLWEETPCRMLMVQTIEFNGGFQVN